MRQLKKTLELPLPNGETIGVNVDFRIIEVVERVYQRNADVVASMDLAAPHLMLRSKVADTIVEWLANRDTGFKRSELREFVILSPPTLLNVFSGCIQGAILFSLKYIDEEDLATLARGESLDDRPRKKEEPESEKGNDDAPAPSSPSATE